MFRRDKSAPDTHQRGRSASGESQESTRSAGMVGFDKHKAVLRLALIYLTSMASVTGISLVSNFLYDQIGLYNLGQLGNFLSYAGMFIGTFFTRSIMGWFRELRSAMYFGLIMIGLPMLAIVWTYGCSEISNTKDPNFFCKKAFLRSINLTANFAMGLFGQAVIWATEYEYIDRVTNLAEKKSYFALFFSVMQFHGVVSALLNFALYSYNIDSLYCFIGFYSIHCLATMSVAFYLPEVSNYKSEPCPEFSLMDYEAEANMVLKHRPEDRLTSASDTMKGFFDTLYNSSKLLRFLPYMLQSGLFQGLVAGVLYRIVETAYTNENLDVGALTPEEKTKEETRIKTQICLVNIFFYLCGLAACRLVLRLNHRQRNWAMRIVSIILSAIGISYWAEQITRFVWVRLSVLGGQMKTSWEATGHSRSSWRRWESSMSCSTRFRQHTSPSLVQRHSRRSRCSNKPRHSEPPCTWPSTWLPAKSTSCGFKPSSRSLPQSRF